MNLERGGGVGFPVVVVVVLVVNGTRTANPDHDCLYDSRGEGLSICSGHFPGAFL